MNHMTWIRRGALALIAAAAVLVGAASLAEAETMRSQARTAPTHEVLATVEHNGATFEFVRDPRSGIIGVAEISHVSQPTVLTSDALKDATPLEVFMAVAGRAKPPAALVRDHEITAREMGRENTRPRTLTLGSTSRMESGAHDYVGGDCSYNVGYIGDSRFTHDWYLANKHRDVTAQQTFEYKHLNGTAGMTSDPGTTSQRWLGACNGNEIFGFPAFQFSAEYRNHGLGGEWVLAYSTQIEPYHKVTYTSFSLDTPKWRVRLSEITYDVHKLRVFGVAVAGTTAYLDMTIGQ